MCLAGVFGRGSWARSSVFPIGTAAECPRALLIETSPIGNVLCRGETSMKCQRFRWIAVVASLMSVVMIGDLKAQVGMGQPLSYAPQPAAYGVAPQHGAIHTAPGDGAGFSFVTPATYSGDGEMYLHGPTIMDGSGACGCEECAGCMVEVCTVEVTVHIAGGRGLGLLSWLAPYGEGGCCAPHWFDIHAEAVFLKLDNEGRSIVFSRWIGLEHRRSPPRISVSTKNRECGFRLLIRRVQEAIWSSLISDC
jgi:hypothetical protein